MCHLYVFLEKIYYKMHSNYKTTKKSKPTQKSRLGKKKKKNRQEILRQVNRARRAFEQSRAGNEGGPGEFLGQTAGAEASRIKFPRLECAWCDGWIEKASVAGICREKDSWVLHE